MSGLGAMTNPELEAFAKAISRVLGWAYFLCWFVPPLLRVRQPQPETHPLLQERFFLPPTDIKLLPQVYHGPRHRLPYPQRTRLYVLHNIHSLLPLLANDQVAIRIQAPRCSGNNGTLQ